MEQQFIKLASVDMWTRDVPGRRCGISSQGGVVEVELRDGDSLFAGRGDTIDRALWQAWEEWSGSTEQIAQAIDENLAVEFM